MTKKRKTACDQKEEADEDDEDFDVHYDEIDDDDDESSSNDDDDLKGGILFQRGRVVKKTQGSGTDNNDYVNQQRQQQQLAVDEHAILSCFHAAIQSHDAIAIVEDGMCSKAPPLFNDATDDLHALLQQWNPAELALPKWAVVPVVSVAQRRIDDNDNTNGESSTAAITTL